MSKSITGNGLTMETDAYVNAYDGNIEQAADIAGLSYEYCRRLMMDITNPHIEPMAIKVQEAIKNRHKQAQNAIIATRQERQALWTEFLNNAELSPTDRMRASELLGKSEGDFIDLKADVTPQSLADIAAITQSRRRKAIESKEIEQIERKNEDE